MKARIVGIALALVASAATAGHAQEQDTTRHNRSIELGAGGSTSIGIWSRNDADRSLGIILNGSLSSQTLDNGTTRTRGFSIEPAMKIHTGGTGTFQPYTFASVFGGIDHVEIDDGDRETGLTSKLLGASLGAGLDWFPVSRVSIGGRVGVRGFYSTASLSEEMEEESEDLDGFSVSTFSSGILVNLFF